MVKIIKLEAGVPRRRVDKGATPMVTVGTSLFGPQDERPRVVQVAGLRLVRGPDGTLVGFGDRPRTEAPR
jgi:hypothetical protein